METFRTAHQERRELLPQLNQQEQEVAERQAEENTRASQLLAAERNHERARDALASAEKAHAAIALAEDLNVGDDCPVCLQPVVALPHHPVPAGLSSVRAAANAAQTEASAARTTHGTSVTATAVASRAVEATRLQLDKVSATLADAPSETDVTQVAGGDR